MKASLELSVPAHVEELAAARRGAWLVAVVGAAILGGLGGLVVAGLSAPRLGAAAFFLPLFGLYRWYQSSRRSVMHAALRPEHLVVRPGTVQVGGALMRIDGASRDGDLLRLSGPLLGAAIYLRATPEEAVRVVETADVPDTAVRTLRARGPIAAIPVLGVALQWLGPGIVVLSLLALQSGGLNASAVWGFAIAMLVGLVASVLVYAPTRLRLTPMGISVHWLGVGRGIPWDAIERIDVDRIRLRIVGRKDERFHLALTNATSAGIHTRDLLETDVAASARRWAAVANARRHSSLTA